MKYPEIRIKDAWLLRQAASQYLHELWAEEGQTLVDDARMEGIVADYIEAWKPYEEKIIHGMCEVLGLEFRQNIIDVNVAPWFHAFSDPMVIGTKYAPSRFVEVLTHEIIHRLLTDNLQTSYSTVYTDDWKKLFGEDHNFVTLVHIPVHAVLQALFVDILGEPDRLKNDREMCKKWPLYDDAWGYVDKHGYKIIIDQLRANYSQIEKRQLVA